MLAPVRTGRVWGCAGLLGAVAFTAWTPEAASYDSLASDCDDTPGQCQIASIAYAAESPNALDLSFDTGWVPSSGPLQVHLAAGVYAKTNVALAGWFAASWPEAIVLETPGQRGGGWFAIQYGAEVVAEAQISISVLGQSVNFTGPIPYVPQFDFVVDDDAEFTSWAFEPGITLSDETQPATLAQVGIDQIIGTSIPGLDGGFELNASIELDATYVTERMVITDPDTGEAMAGGDIEAADGTSALDYLGGPSFEALVHPEGRVTYDGVLHLVPAFYVEFLGQDFSIPIADIPIPFSTDEAWVFEDQHVHVPLPDVDVAPEAIDFGEGSFDTPAYSMRPIRNEGEAVLVFEVASSDPDVVEVSDETVEVEPGEEAALALVFSPEEPGAHEVTITLTSNDPDEPVIELTAVGEGTSDRPKLHLAGGAPENLDVEDGCGCEVVGEAKTSGAWWLVGLLALPFVRRLRPHPRRVARSGA